MEKLQCGLICEKEQIATLGMEQSNMQAQLHKAREQKRSLEAELGSVMEESRRKVCTLLSASAWHTGCTTRAYILLTLTCSLNDCRLISTFHPCFLTLFCDLFMQSEHNQVVISQLKEDVRLSAEQLESLNSHYTLMEADNQQKKQKLDSANSEIAKLKAQLSMMNSDLGSTKNIKESLQKKLEMAKQQLDNVTTSLSAKVSMLAIELC